MQMSEPAILRDCLDTLKHASMCYLRASHEADSDGLRKTFDRLAIDKSEQKNAVFNLMHQADHYKTYPANPDRVVTLKRACEDLLAKIGTGQAVDRERGRVANQHVHT